MDSQQILSMMMLSSAALAETYISNCSRNKLAIENVLNRIKIHCNSISHSLGNSSENLIKFFNSIQDLEHYIFTKAGKTVDITHLHDLLDICHTQLRVLLDETMSVIDKNRGNLTPPSFHTIILLIGDLRIIQGLFIKEDQNELHLIDLHDHERLEAEDFIMLIERRQQSLIDRSQLAISPSVFTPATCDSELSVTMSDQHFVVLSKDLGSFYRRQLAQIFTFNQQLSIILKDLQHHVKEVQQGLIHLEPSVSFKLDYLLSNLNYHMNTFLDTQDFPPAFSTDMTSADDVESAQQTYADCAPHDTDHSMETNEPHPDKKEEVHHAQVSDDDFEALLNSVESAKQPVKYVQPTEEMLKVLKERCGEEDIPDAAWSHSTTSDSGINVHGKGITAEKKQRLEAELSKCFPEYQFTFADSDTASNNLSCIVYQKTCNREQPEVEWFENAMATCELILKGNQPHKGRRECLFAVTSAHLLLYKEEMSELEKNDENFHLKLQSCRDDVQKRIDKFVYTAVGTDSPIQVHLCNPPLLSYRNLKYTHDNRSYDFMMDIALIPIESDNNVSLRRLVNSAEICQLASILSLNQGRLLTLTRRNPPIQIYASKRKGQLLPMEQPVDDSDDVPSRGLHIPFKLHNG